VPGQAPKPPPAPACVMVIFGARGDLAKRLLVPSLYNLAHAGLLDDKFRVLGFDHGDCDEADYRKLLGDFLREMASDPNSEFGKAKIDAKTWKWLEERISYQRGDFEDPASFRGLAQRLDEVGGKGASAIFYLAVAPRFFGEVAEQIGKAGLAEEPRGAFRRLVIEKPFGDDLASAKALNARILKSLAENQVYRIDHFLGKETVRNLMVTRFGNGVFEPLWNRQHIDSVQITAAETLGVEDRGGYYDSAGALRDMIPNHLFQLLALTAMEAPNSLDADAVRAERTRVIEAIKVATPKEAEADGVRGQYQAGEAGGRKLIGYRASPKVDPKSRTETYAALKLSIDNWRWAGVPFYLRTGKAMSGRDTEIAIRFKGAPHALFGRGVAPNTLVLQIQPDEGISLEFEAKEPGPEVALQTVRMQFLYSDWFQHEPSTGYETLIYDCLIGDQTLFKRADEIEYAWRAVGPFLKAWETGEPDFYRAGSDGPKAAATLLSRDGRAWRPVGHD
jgi:glucose-6-phosphate 1-dehydrogenase